MVASIAAATIAWMLPTTPARAILTAAAACAVVIDIGRRRGGAFGRTFDRVVGSMLRPHERRRWTGATTLAAGFALAAWAVPPTTAAVAFVITGLADPAAAAVGRRFGRVRSPWGKSIAGTAAFTLTGLAIVFALPAVQPLPGSIAVVAAAFVEAAPIDDNLAVPITAALLLYALGAVA